MVEAQDTNNDTSKKEKAMLAKIEPVKVQANSPDIKPSNTEDATFEGKIELEKALISSTILLLREYGIRKSGAAVRDAVDISHQDIGPKEAVSSLSSLGFKASFGRLNITNLSEEFFPLIAFKKMAQRLLCFLLRLMVKYL